MTPKTINPICPSYGAALREEKRSGEEKVTGLQVARAWLAEGESTGERIIYGSSYDRRVEQFSHAMDHDGGVLARVLDAGSRKYAVRPRAAAADIDGDGDHDKDDVKAGLRRIAQLSLTTQERADRSIGLAFGADESAEMLADIARAKGVLESVEQIVIQRSTRRRAV